MKRLLLSILVVGILLLVACSAPAVTEQPTPAPSKNIDPRQIEAFEDAAKLEEEKLAKYYIYKGPFTGYEQITLTTIGTWEGEDSKIIEFSSDKSPIVVNGVYEKVSKVDTLFDISYQGGLAGPKLDSKYWVSYPNEMEGKGGIVLKTITLQGTGKYRLKVEASGVRWWIKIGVE